MSKNKGKGAGGKNTTVNGLSFELKTSIENKLLENNFKKVITNKKSKYGYFLEYEQNNHKIVYLTQFGFKLYFKNEFNIDTYKQPDEAFLIFNGSTYHLKILEKKNQNVDGSVEDKLKTGLFNKKEYEKMLNNNILINNITNNNLLNNNITNNNLLTNNNLSNNNITNNNLLTNNNLSNNNITNNIINNNILNNNLSNNNILTNNIINNKVFHISYAFCISNFLQAKFQSNQQKYNIIKEIMDEDGIKIFYGDDKNYFDLLFKWIMNN